MAFNFEENLSRLLTRYDELQALMNESAGAAKFAQLSKEYSDLGPIVEQIQALRRDLHAHPELCFEEVRTSDLVADTLTGWGIEVHRGLGKTGVVGVIQGRPGPRAVGLRADMDALPMTEHNTFAHASRHPGRMHACGHDGHTAMLLAAARHLSSHRDFDGTVYLVFQPAEEGGGGRGEEISAIHVPLPGCRSAPRSFLRRGLHR